MNRIASALTICCLSLTALPGVADESHEGPNVSVAPSEKAQATPQAQTMEVYRLGAAVLSQARDYESVPAMLTAVDMLGRAQVEDSAEHFGDKSEEADGAEAQADAPDKAASGAVDVSSEALLAYLDEAAAWAEGDEASLALIQTKRGEVQAMAGAVTMGALNDRGQRVPIRHVDQVNALTKDIYRVKFEGGRRAELMVIGDGDTDLDLRVYDAAGNLIVSDTDNSDRCVVTWTPRWTGTFKIEISNLGRVYNRYSMISN